MATRSWNRVELIGNLTRDVELRFTPTGTAVATFSIATNRAYVVDGEKKEEADFHRIVAWNKLAELCNQLLKKGNKVFVSGRLQNRSWEGQDGQQKNTTEIVIEDMILLTNKSDGGASEYSDVSSRTDEDVTSKALSPKADETPVKDATPEEAPPKAKTEDPGNLDDLPF